MSLPCDNCGGPIPADYADVPGTGLRMCDACLARPDDDPEALFRAAAEHKACVKIEKIEAVIAGAEGVVIPEPTFSSCGAWAGRLLPRPSPSRPATATAAR